jgi:hypothetical protein
MVWRRGGVDLVGQAPPYIGRMLCLVRWPDPSLALRMTQMSTPGTGPGANRTFPSASAGGGGPPNKSFGLAQDRFGG